MPKPTTQLIFLALMFLLTTSGYVFALQEQDEENVDFATATKNIQTRVEADQNLEQATKDQITSLISAAQANESALKLLQQKTEEAKSAKAAAAKVSRDFQRQLERLKGEAFRPVSPNIDMEQLDEEVTRYRQEVDELKQQLEFNEEESTRRIARQQNARTQLDAFDKRIGDIKAQQKLTSRDNSLIGQANTLKLQTDLRVAEAELAELEAVLARDEAEEREGVLKSQHDFLEQNLQRQSAKLDELEAIQANKRQKVAEQLTAAAIKKQQAIKDSIPLLLKSYEVNTELAQRNQSLEDGALDAKQKADALKKAVESLEKKFLETKGRVDAIGLTGSVGAMLRTRKKELADEAAKRLSDLDTTSSIEELQYEIFDLDQLQKDLSADLIRDEIVAVYGQQENATWNQLDQPIADAVEARNNILKATRASLTRYSGNLLDIQSKETDKKATIARFREYINERILWIRSNKLLFSELKLDDSDRTALEPAKWGQAGNEIVRSFSSYPAITFLAALISLLLLIIKPSLRTEIDRLGATAARGSCATFWPTAKAFVLSVLIAISIPSIPLLIGLAIYFAPFEGSNLFTAIGRAAIASALFAIPFEALRRLCRPNGLGSQHFDWPASSVSKLKKNLNWVVLPGSILVFAVTLLHNLDLAHRIDLIERILFVGGMLFATYFLYRICNNKDGVFSGYLRSHERSWANQTSTVWTGIILLIPLGLAFLAIWGYYYTALNLAECAYFTFVFAVIVETLRALARRLILTRQRRSFIQAAHRKRQAQIEAQRTALKEQAKANLSAAERGEMLPADSIPTPIETFDVLTEMQPEEIAENVVQAQKLISLGILLVWVVGIWLIWIDVLPALKELDNYTIWPSQVVENGFSSEPVASSEGAGQSAVTNPAGPLASGAPPSDSVVGNREIEKLKNRVTVRDLLLFFVISIVTWMSARSLPSAIEILFLEELPVDRSFRYAIKALTSYAIVLVGVVLAFRTLSISWSSVQWLATALTFGLAFGLQEIFANFVAGIILMFERPMRIGDLITVDNFTGVVTKIRTRATTIVNWDRKEYVIPNKDFITGRLVNWTLSDAINRIEFVVGIAYGSDVDHAKSIIYEICKNHPKVVDDPATQVVFTEFGDSSLNLNVRAFIGDVDSRPAVSDSLHTLINNAFNEAGIEIAFPQRDLHVRTIDVTAADAVQQITKNNKRNQS